MKKKKKINRMFYCLIMAVLLLSSCTSYKKVPYLKEIETSSKDTIDYAFPINEPRIMPNDIISITVNSTLVGAVADFNLPLVPNNLNKVDQSVITPSSTGAGSMQNYWVDKSGNVDFPVLGQIKIEGMTLEEAKNTIENLIYPKYISERPIVNIRFINFKVSVLGEVLRPGVYTAENGQMTILDALAAAGDMTIFGKRNNVLLVRTQSNGNLETYRINLQEKDIVLNPELFYLQQNDKIYVEPNKTRGNNASVGSVETVGLSLLSILISLAIVLTR